MKKILTILIVLLLAGNIAGSSIEGNNAFIISEDRTLTFYLVNDSSQLEEYYLKYYCDADIQVTNYVAVGRNSAVEIPVKVRYLEENNSYACVLVAQNSEEKIAKSFDLEFKDKDIVSENSIGLGAGLFSLGLGGITFFDIVLIVIVILLLLAFVTRFVNYKGEIK